jgi:hypothetical protein
VAGEGLRREKLFLYNLGVNTPPVGTDAEEADGLKVHKIEIFLASILNFVLFHC